jgi:hypothetical protein
VKDHIFAVAQAIARAKGFDPRDAELWAIVEEQFVHPHQRTLNRYNRKADEMLCQTLERDERFQEAVTVAKGGAF